MTVILIPQSLLHVFANHSQTNADNNTISLCYTFSLAKVKDCDTNTIVYTLLLSTAKDCNTNTTVKDYDKMTVILIPQSLLHVWLTTAKDCDTNTAVFATRLADQS